MSGKILKGTEIGKKLEQQGGSLLPPVTHQGVVRKEELKARDQSQVIIDDARKEARKILEEANQLKARVEKEMEESKCQGYEEGKAQGLEEFTKEILSAKELKEKFHADAEPEIVKLVLNIAEKVIGEMVLKHKEAIQSIIHQALGRSLGERIVVRLHPDDWKRIQDEEKMFKEKLDKTKHLHFKEDDTIQRGGCVIATEVGTIDAQLETQLKAIRKAFGI